MDKDDLKKLAKDPKYISGIYNYCDRWCERCSFTSRCLNCALVEEQFGDLEKVDQLNEAFWEKKENDFAHLISHTSKNYAKSVDLWFNSNEYLFFEKEEEMNRIRLLSSHDNPIKEAMGINDATEVIRWYQWQIHVKLKRAIESASTEESPDFDEFPKDSDGSAKVALIGIDRTMPAWKILLTAFPEREKQILSFVAMLEHIKNRVETQFPHAKDFIRPGFDDIRHSGR